MHWSYVANFGDGTVFVIDSTTNQVIDTINARSGPADVTVTTRAHPLVLKYKFQSIAPAGALFSWARGINNHGDAVGDYFDSFGYHGFLHTHDGTLTTIDPPGTAATSAFSVNDSGVVVGTYRDSLNVLHGFQRSSSGRYITLDFPGAGDSQLTGINNSGETAGVYDSGNLGSARCPGPACEAISFLLKNGHYTSFNSPLAAPASTFAQSINDRGQVAGFYQDTSGAVAGFLRRSNGTFKTVKFPAAGNYSTVDQVNNSGVMAGEYQVTFLQGYFSFGSHFLSIDYPNSLASGLRGVNDRGEVSGYFVSPSGVFEAYVATPQSD